MKSVIADHQDAWCEDGVQVGALARAKLAVYYAGEGRLNEAERLAEEVRTLFPEAIDESGAPLGQALLQGLVLMRPPSPQRRKRVGSP